MKWKQIEKNDKGSLTFKDEDEILRIDKPTCTVYIGFEGYEEPEIVEEFKTLNEAIEFANKYMKGVEQ